MSYESFPEPTMWNGPPPDDGPYPVYDPEPVDYCPHERLRDAVAATAEALALDPDVETALQNHRAGVPRDNPLEHWSDVAGRLRDRIEVLMAAEMIARQRILEALKKRGGAVVSNLEAVPTANRCPGFRAELGPGPARKVEAYVPESRMRRLEGAVPLLVEVLDSLTPTEADDYETRLTDVLRRVCDVVVTHDVAWCQSPYCDKRVVHGGDYCDDDCATANTQENEL